MALDVRSTDRPADDVSPARIIALLAANGEMSRAELSRSLGVAAATVTMHVKRLIAAGLIAELPPRRRSSGRPIVPLTIASDLAVAIGIQVAPRRLIAVARRLDGSILREWSEPASLRTHDPIRTLVKHVRQIIDQVPGRPGILGIGLALPGIVEEQSGVARLSAVLGWADIDVAARMSELLGVQVVAENDLYADALSELVYGIGQSTPDFLLLGIGNGIGVSIVRDRQIMRGPLGAAGDLGHSVVPGNDLPCSCGNRGCLQTIASMGALVKAAAEVSAVRKAADLLRAAKRGDSAVLEILNRAAEHVALPMSGLVNVLGINTIHVTGELAEVWSTMEPRFTEVAEASVLSPYRPLRITTSTWTRYAHARAAAGLVADRLVLADA